MTPPASGVSRARFVVLYGLIVLWQVWWLLLTPHGLASTWTRGHDLDVASTAGAGVSQEILMGADGLDGLWVRAASEHRGRPPLRGQVIVTLARVIDGQPIPVLRSDVEAARLGTGRPVHLPFRQIRASRGQRFRVTLAHTGSDDRGVLYLQARRSDAHPDARFFVDGVEQWGDLLFETSAGRATLPYWKHEVLAPWPSWMQSWATVGAVLLLVNLLLARACAVAARRGVAAHDAVRPSTDDRSGVARRTAFLAVGALVAVGLATLLRPIPSHRVIRLTHHMADARLETTWPSLHAGLAVQPVVVFARLHESIVALPTSRMSWTLDVPKGALLLGHVAMRPDVWHVPSDGANLTVSVVPDGGDEVEVARYTLVPYLVEEHRALHPLRVSLDPWAGQTVTLVFETDPERWGNAVNDVPLWVDPRIEWPRGAAWGEARIAPTHTPQNAAAPARRPAIRR